MLREFYEQIKQFGNARMAAWTRMSLLGSTVNSSPLASGSSNSQQNTNAMTSTEFYAHHEAIDDSKLGRVRLPPDVGKDAVAR